MIMFLPPPRVAVVLNLKKVFYCHSVEKIFSVWEKIVVRNQDL